MYLINQNVNRLIEPYMVTKKTIFLFYSCEFAILFSICFVFWLIQVDSDDIIKRIYMHCTEIFLCLPLLNH